VKLTVQLSIVTLLILAGCGGPITTSSSGGATSGTTSAPTSTSQATPQIVLSYADWGDQELNQRMIDLFEARYPHIKVELRQDITGSGDAFTGNLILAAQAGFLPDVFATDNVPTVVNAGLTLDVAEYWDADPETDLIYENIASTGVYNGKRFAVPSFQFLKGILINLDIFERANLNTVAGQYRIDDYGYPVKDWTFEEMINIAKEIQNFDLMNPENLVIGLDTWYGTPDFQQVWPTMQNTTTQYDTWDGTQFNYTSQAWIDAMKAKVDLHQLTDGTTSRFDSATLEANTILQNNYFINTGYGAMDIEGSWQFWVINNVKEKLDMDIGFWPYPQGSAGLFPPTILDFQAISTQTLYPEEAYLLAKWMTFGRDGWDARLDLLEADRQDAIDAGETPVYLDRFPIADYPEAWTRVEGLVDGIEGIDYIFDRIAFSKPDLDKWLPGYKDFWAWVYSVDPTSPNYNPYNWNNLVSEGSSAVPVYAQQWQTQVNTLVSQQLANLGKTT
jgi:multiple sugar transport system substrate-binding protein